MMYADVVSVASPGSSDGGSEPIAIRSTCALALLASPLPVVAADVPTTATLRTATSPAQRKRLSILSYPSLSDRLLSFPPYEACEAETSRPRRGLDGTGCWLAPLPTAIARWRRRLPASSWLPTSFPGVGENSVRNAFRWSPPRPDRAGRASAPGRGRPAAGVGARAGRAPLGLA